MAPMLPLVLVFAESNSCLTERLCWQNHWFNGAGCFEYDVGIIGTAIFIHFSRRRVNMFHIKLT